MNYDFEMQTRRVPPCMDDLRRLARHNPMVKAVLSAWELGGYPSLESALIGLAVALADQNEKVQRQIMYDRPSDKLAFFDALTRQKIGTVTTGPGGLKFKTDDETPPAPETEKAPLPPIRTYHTNGTSEKTETVAELANRLMAVPSVVPGYFDCADLTDAAKPRFFIDPAGTTRYACHVCGETTVRLDASPPPPGWCDCPPEPAVVEDRR